MIRGTEGKGFPLKLFAMHSTEKDKQTLNVMLSDNHMNSLDLGSDRRHISLNTTQILMTFIGGS